MGVAALPAPLRADTVTIACSALGVEQMLCREGAEAWAEATGHEVEIVNPPQSASEQLALYQQLLNSQSGDIDVLQIDVVWPGILGSHFLDLAPHIDADRLEAQIPAAIDTVRRGESILALPWFVDAPLLYYRADLLAAEGLEVPQTWEQLTQTALRLQDRQREAGNDRFWGFVWQGRAYEGLTCNALEWVDSFGGGTFIAEDGAVTLDNPQAAAALDLAATWVGTISPQGVLNYMEEDSRAVFQSGNAAFMRNWPYAFGLANAEDSPVTGLVGVAPLPQGPDGKRSGTLGGQSLAVSRYSEAPEAAIDLVLHLTSRDEQRRRAVTGGFAPSFSDLYADADVLAAAPFMPTPGRDPGRGGRQALGRDRRPIQRGLRDHLQCGPRRPGRRGVCSRPSRGGKAGPFAAEPRRALVIRHRQHA